MIDTGSIGEGLRNLEYMQECAARYPDDDERDPFYLKSTKVLQRQAMEDAGLIPNYMQPKADSQAHSTVPIPQSCLERHEVWLMKRQGLTD